MAKVLYGISPIGLGHATRSFEIIKLLRDGGNEVTMFTGGNAADFARESGWEAEDIVSDPVPHVSGGRMDRVVLWYIRSWLAFRRTKPKTRELIRRFVPDIVVCDEEFSGIVLAEEMGIKHAFITDELELGFARSRLARRVEARVDRWYHNLQQEAELMIIPDDGADSGNTVHVGPIVRKTTETKEAVSNKLGISGGSMLVLLSLSGSGIGDFLIDRVMEEMRSPRFQSHQLVITGNRGPKISSTNVQDLGVVLENQNFISAADLVISTAGKSTIDEASAAGTPIIAIPIKNHAEQERNARALGYDFEDIDRLGTLIGQKLGRREAPRNFRGAEKASQAILSML